MEIAQLEETQKCVGISDYSLNTRDDTTARIDGHQIVSQSTRRTR
jgi:hypothetical protein